MPILDAALAFALTMLAVATLVTQIVRLPQGLCKWYAKGLDEMLNRYFASEVGPAVERVIQRLSGTPLSATARKLVETAGHFDWHKLIREPGSTDDKPVSKETLMEVFKNSYLDKEFREELGEDTKAVYKELERRYQVAEEKATDQFKRRSQKWATYVALVLALVLNIDSIHIANSYFRDEKLRQGVVAEMEVIVAKYEAAVQAVANSADKGTTDGLIQAVADTREQVDLLASSGFPVGWSYFPHARILDKSSTDYENRNHLLGWVWWVLGVVLTGILAGLGAPFWFDAISGISRVAQTAGLTKKSTQREEEARKPDGP